MAGRGKRRPIHKSIKINKKNKRNTKKDSEVSIWSRRRSKELRNPLFVEGGVLADWSPSHSGRSGNVKWNPKKGSKPGNSNKGKAGSGSKNAPRKSSGNAFGCNYPCYDPQEGTSRYVDEVQPIVLVDSKETQIVAYFDETPTLKACNRNLTYEYSSDFLLGDSSHRGLGFGEKFEATPGAQSSSKQMEEEEQKGSSFGSSSFEKEMNSDDTTNCKAGEEMLTAAFSPKKNSAFLSIGGVKLFTQDITDGGSDWESLDESSESQRAELSQSGDSDDTFNSELDVDDKVAEDYLEGIGGSSNILDDKWLVEYVLDDSDEDSSSSGCFDETLENLGGIALQEASRRYGMKKPQSKKNHALSARDVSQDFDDFMHLKDPRTVSAKRKHVAHLPRSRPSKARRSKTFRSFPGDKKKHGKEMIAVKRHQRMMSRGVDLEKINKLIGAGDEDADFAVNEGSKTKSVSADRNRKKKSTRRSSGRNGLYANQPVSFVSSGVVQSGVIETITVGAQEINETCENKDATSSSNFGAFEVHTKGFGSKMMGKMGFIQGGGLGKDGQGMAQPIEAIQRPKSLGLGVDFSNISGDSVKNKPQSIGTGTGTGTGKSRKHSKTQSFGAFEKHTKGFGSKMMARMGFVEGMGLGVDSQGIANPLVAVRRPKAWELGAKG
ncbi:Zinc finger protein [Salix suchowensis]|nr:Zinc finger protein [Salix suchowensis]